MKSHKEILVRPFFIISCCVAIGIVVAIPAVAFDITLKFFGDEIPTSQFLILIGCCMFCVAAAAGVVVTAYNITKYMDM